MFTKPSLFHGFLYVLVLLFLIAIIVLDIVLDDEMFKDSSDFSVRFQSATGVEWLAWIFSNLIAYLIPIYCFVAFFFREDKIRAAHTFLSVFIMFYWSNFLKLLYIDSRPSFNNPLLKQGGSFCEKDYGKPSGHAFTATCLMLFVAQDFNRFTWRNPWLNWLNYLLAIIISFCMIFARIYYGVHTYNQLLLGAAWGMAIFGAMNLTRPMFNRYLYIPCLTKRAGKRENFIAIVINLFMIVTVIVSLLTAWGVTRGKEDLSEPFFRAIVNCTYVLEDMHNNFATKIAAEGLLSLFPWAFFLGCRFSKYEALQGFQLFMKRDFLKGILRILVYILFLWPIIFGFAPKSNNAGGKVGRAIAFILPFPFLFGMFCMSFLKKVRLFPDVPILPILPRSGYRFNNGVLDDPIGSLPYSYPGQTYSPDVHLFSNQVSFAPQQPPVLPQYPIVNHLSPMSLQNPQSHSNSPQMLIKEVNDVTEVVFPK